MLVAILNKIMNVWLSTVTEYMSKMNHSWLILGFEEANYYPEKSPDGRVRRERVPVWKTRH